MRRTAMAATERRATGHLVRARWAFDRFRPVFRNVTDLPKIIQNSAGKGTESP
jgi:hypothetical protein